MRWLCRAHPIKYTQGKCDDCVGHTQSNVHKENTMTAPPPQAGNIVSRSCGICICSSWSFGSGFWPSGSSSWSSISWCSSSRKTAFTCSLRILSSSSKTFSLSLRTLPLSNFSRLSSGSSWIDAVVRLRAHWSHWVLYLSASILIVSRHANTSLKLAVLNFCFRYLFSFSFHLRRTKNSCVTRRPAGELDGYRFPQLLSKLLGSSYYQLQHKLGNYSIP